VRNLLPFILIILLVTGCPFQTGAEGEGGSPLTALLPFILIFVVFYFLILRPQQKQGKQRKEMLKNIKRGDNVITSGGMYGKILNIVGDLVTLEIAKGISIRLSRSGISGLGGPHEEDGKAKEEKSEK